MNIHLNHFIAIFFSTGYAKYCRSRPTFDETTVEQKSGHFLNQGVYILHNTVMQTNTTVHRQQESFPMIVN